MCWRCQSLRRVWDRYHVRHVAKQPCLVCGRQPCDPHHLRFTQSRALGRKVSDEFTVPLCRGHHREVHKHGDEGAWWRKVGIDPMLQARALWLETHLHLTDRHHLSGRSGGFSCRCRNRTDEGPKRSAGGHSPLKPQGKIGQEKTPTGRRLGRAPMSAQATSAFGRRAVNTNRRRHVGSIVNRTF